MTIKEKKTKVEVLETRLEKHLTKAKEAAKQLEALEKRRKAREKSQARSNYHKDLYTLGLVMKFIILKQYNPAALKISTKMLKEAFPKEKTERYIECLQDHGITIVE